MQHLNSSLPLIYAISTNSLFHPLALEVEKNGTYLLFIKSCIELQKAHYFDASIIFNSNEIGQTRRLKGNGISHDKIILFFSSSIFLTKQLLSKILFSFKLFINSSCHLCLPATHLISSYLEKINKVTIIFSPNSFLPKITFFPKRKIF